MSASYPFSARDIEAEYRRLGHKLGWRLFTCSVTNIVTADTALITINPGGDKLEESLWALETGSAYTDESWKNKPPGEAQLQRQVKRMFELMNVCPANVLSGYFVPFRSPNWGALQEKPASLAFGTQIWRDILSEARPKTTVAFGKDLANHIATLLNATDRRQHQAGWGDQTIDTYSYGSSGKLIVLPHLSRFALFNRMESEQHFLKMLAET